MRVLILGAAGVLGSSLVSLFSRQGHSVAGIDVQRPDEAWRLLDATGGQITRTQDPHTYYLEVPSGSRVTYVWSYVQGALPRLRPSDFDVVVDAAIGSADRPMGTASPRAVAWANLEPALAVYEWLSFASGGVDPSPVVIYPSSFNALYGRAGTTFTEDTPPDPASAYGWTKAAAELLYRALARERNARVIITRVGSAYGPRGRSDELPHRLTVEALRERPLRVRSPEARRLWTYQADVADFYLRLLSRLDLAEPGRPVTLHVAGNRGDRVVSNVELARIISGMTTRVPVEPIEYYEPGEVIDGRPVSFESDARVTRQLLGWEPKYSLEEGLKETVEWFKSNLRHYQ